MRNLFPSSLLAGIVLLCAAPAQSQDTLMVFGTVKDYLTGEPLTAFTMHANDVDDPSHVRHAQVDAKGRYALDITEERTYRIVYAAEGYIRKQVQVEVKGPTPEQWIGGFGMQVDISLLPEHPSYTEVLGEVVFGMARFDAEQGLFAWDIAYTEALRDAQRELIRAYDKDVGRTSNDR